MTQCIGYGIKMGSCPNATKPNSMFCQQCENEVEREVSGRMANEPSSRPPDLDEQHIIQHPGIGLDFQVLDFIDQKFEELKVFIVEKLNELHKPTKPPKKTKKKSLDGQVD